VQPPGHFLVAFGPVFAYVVFRDRRRPSMGLVWIVVLGSQWPDLIDKPLANYTDLIPTGRVFMHSLPVALPVSMVALAYAKRTGRDRAGYAFVFAYLLHLVGDNYPGFLESSPRAWWDLLWPLTPAKARPEVPYWAGPDQSYVNVWTGIALVILSVAVAALVRDVHRQLD
jgi:hypothetical protein